MPSKIHFASSNENSNVLQHAETPANELDGTQKGREFGSHMNTWMHRRGHEDGSRGINLFNNYDIL